MLTYTLIFFHATILTSMIFNARPQSTTKRRQPTTSPHVKYIEPGQFPWHACVMFQDYPIQSGILTTVRTVVCGCLPIAKVSKNETMFSGLKNWKEYSIMVGSVSCSPQTAQFYQRRNIAYWRVHPACLRRVPLTMAKYPNLGIIFLSQDFLITPVSRPIQAKEMYSLDWGIYSKKLESIFSAPDKHNCSGVSVSSTVVPEIYREKSQHDPVVYSQASIYSGGKCLDDYCLTDSGVYSGSCVRYFPAFNGFCVKFPQELQCTRAPSLAICDGMLVGLFVFHKCNSKANGAWPPPYMFTRFDSVSNDDWTKLMNGQWNF